jgi:hypothetical protein
VSNRADAELKARFSALRAGEAAEAPAFRLPVSVARRSRRIPLALAAGALLAAGAGAALGYVALRGRRPLPDVDEILAWRAPTDFLLPARGRVSLTGSAIDRFIPSTALFQGGQP